MTKHQLIKRYTNKGQLTKKQARILGLQYPLKKGWIHSIVEPLTPAEIKAFINSFNNPKGTANVLYKTETINKAITKEELFERYTNSRTPTRKQAAILGLSFPLQKGWFKKLKNNITAEEVLEFSKHTSFKRKILKNNKKVTKNTVDFIKYNILVDNVVMFYLKLNSNKEFSFNNISALRTKFKNKISKMNKPVEYGYVYLIHMETTNNYKIGKSVDVAKRLCSLQVGSPYKLNVVTKILAHNPIATESFIHQLFGNYKLSGEWFNISSVEIKDLVGTFNRLDIYSLHI